MYANGESLAELSEALGTSRTTTPKTELQASGIAGTGGPYAAGGGVVVAQAGETLRSLSQRVYGSSSYWYVLAEANGYSSGDEVIATGQGLKAPALSVSRNDSSTYRPFDPNTALGGVMGVPVGTPNSQGCQQVGQLLMVVVAVIVTIYTAGAAGAAMGAATSGTGIAATMSTGLSVLGGTATVAGGAAMGAGAMMTAAAVGGAVGSIASQFAGVMTGAIQDFSWRGVATSALTAGVGAGIGSVAKALEWGRTASMVASGLGTSTVNAAMSDSFSWRQVAANVVGNAIGSSIGNGVGNALGRSATTLAGQFAADFAGKMVGGMVSLHARRKLGSDEGVNYGNVAADAFANTLVNRWTGQHAAGADAVRMRRAAEHGLGDPSRIGQGLAFAANARAMAELESATATFGLGSDAESAAMETLPDSRRSRRTVQAAAASPQAMPLGQLSGSGGRTSGPRSLDLLDFRAALSELVAGGRGAISGGVRIFDQDALAYTWGFGEGGMPTALWQRVDATRQMLRSADLTVPGAPTLIALFPEGMSRSDRLANALRIGGGYIDEAAAENLLAQVNSDARAIDLSVVRGQSELYLEGMLNSAPLAGARQRQALTGFAALRFGDTQASARLVRQQQMEGLIASDALMPMTLKISERGVMREVQRAQMLAGIAGFAVDAPLALGMAMMRRGGTRIASVSAVNAAGHSRYIEELGALQRQGYLSELAANGVKHSPDNVIDIRRMSDGRLVFLETGSSRAGLKHILEAHGADFARVGIYAEQVPEAVMTAVTRGRIIGYQGRDTGRPIFDYLFNDTRQRMAVTISDKGFIVGANPRARPGAY